MTKITILASPKGNANALNPYSYLLYKNFNKKKFYIDDFNFKNFLTNKYDIIHFHWPIYHYYNKNFYLKLIRSILFLSILYSKKIFKSKILWTVHNLDDHDLEPSKFDIIIKNLFINLCDGFIFLTAASKNEFLNKYKKKISYKIIQHGLYENIYKEKTTKKISKRKLNLPKNDKIILFFGSIRNYKNVNNLIDIFTNYKKKNISLVIAGNNQANNEFLNNLKKKIYINSFIKYQKIRYIYFLDVQI